MRLNKLPLKLLACSSVLSMAIARGQNWQSPAAGSGVTDSALRVTLKVTAEYKKNVLLDMSEDGRLLLFYQTGTPVHSFRIPLGGGKVKADQPDTHDDLLRVVERETGREVAHIATVWLPYDETFVPGAHEVFYEEPLPHPQIGHVYKLWDFASGAARVCFDAPKKEYLGKPVFIDQNRGLQIIKDTSSDGSARASSFARISLPHCVLETLDRTTDDLPIYTPLTLAPGRDALVYNLPGTGEMLFRDSTTLNKIKEIKAPPGNYFGRPMYARNGTRLGVITSNALGATPETKYHVLFYDTANYNLVKQLDITRTLRRSIDLDFTGGPEAVAVSPDGGVLAVATHEHRQTRNILHSEVAQSFITLYDLENGQQVGSASYPKISYDWNDPWKSRINYLAFTPDGKYLLSGGYDTRVWQIEEQTSH